MNVKICICDDSSEERAFINVLVREWSRQTGTDVSVSEFPTAEAFLFEYEDLVPDVLLLDIEMPGMNGVELAKRLREGNKLIQIVFITGFSDYIAEGYEVAALHYLLKPVSPQKLFSTLDRALEKQETDGRKIVLETTTETVQLLLCEIRYIEVIKNYITVYAEGSYTVKRTLKEIERELDERFLRVGRSYIVNLHFISRVTRSEIFLRGGASVPLPRGAYEKVNRAVINLKS
ncbi:transcriptional regulatory protein BtsR [Lachnospiraceae bacterium]|jgi:DNA-binding LytR/AlgR family response regulator|nr:response regulator transcription factor [Lachnospiraceae bacterium]GFI65825.1 transcriptional regulatory protein BtsR [Lachnospiraceae bacterium]